MTTQRPGGGTARALRCRAILDADIDAVVALLVEGFASRTADHWRGGIARHLGQPLPDGVPRLGYVLVSDDELVGVLLTLYTTRSTAEGPSLVCNLSSWYVRPAFRPYAGLLDSAATRRKDVTYVNISAVRRTWPMHEARGFQRFCSGEFVALPLLSPPRRGVRVRGIDEASPMPELPSDEARILADHARFGCISLIATDAAGSEPLVFIRRPAETLRQRLGWSPVSYFHLVYGRPTLEWPRFAHALGRHLLRRHGMPWMVVDAVGPVPGLVGHFVRQWGTKFSRGPAPMRTNDLGYSELVLFGA